MPELVVTEVRIGEHRVPVEHWQCSWCPLQLHDRAAVVRHEQTCPDRDDGLW